MPSKKQFFEIVEAFLDPEVESDHDIEMRWYEEHDGDTNWHTLFSEPSMARHGLFPHQAEYRMKKK